ncbi:MAG: hypothetical protein NTW21_25320 [Verrucomicrobia bacterium]|nr:hypothetical protein [Verrucomicrobiota bacterium]
MAAFSRDLVHWTAHPDPRYKAGGNPSGLDQQYAHKFPGVHLKRFTGQVRGNLGEVSAIAIKIGRITA